MASVKLFSLGTSVVISLMLTLLIGTFSVSAHVQSTGKLRADFNGDGFADLAVGVPGETLGNISSAGAVNVIYGSTGGLTPFGNQFWTQDSSGIMDRSQQGDGFGSSLVVGDFNGDGFSDLGVGVPGEDIGAISGAGAVNVLYGSSTVLTRIGDQFWSQNTSGILDKNEPGDGFGDSLD